MSWQWKIKCQVRFICSLPQIFETFWFHHIRKEAWSRIWKRGGQFQISLGQGEAEHLNQSHTQDTCIIVQMSGSVSVRWRVAPSFPTTDMLLTSGKGVSLLGKTRPVWLLTQKQSVSWGLVQLFCDFPAAQLNKNCIFSQTWTKSLLTFQQKHLSWHVFSMEWPHCFPFVSEIWLRAPSAVAISMSFGSDIAEGSVCMCMNEVFYCNVVFQDGKVKSIQVYFSILFASGFGSVLLSSQDSLIWLYSVIWNCCKALWPPLWLCRLTSHSQKM